jgi:hypothetical protein
MCEKCGNIDKKIEQLRQLVGPGTDSLSLAMIRAAIDSLRVEKASFKCAAACLAAVTRPTKTRL